MTHPGRLLVRLLLGALIVVGLFLVTAPAQAHAVLSSSTPAPGSTVGVVPAVVTLVYDEPLVSALSDATVTSPTGQRFTATVSGKTMQVHLQGSASGAYRVDWRTVSRVDGHTISGHFEFGVGVKVAASSILPAVGGTDLWLAVPRGIEYALVLLTCGLALLQVLARSAGVRLPRRWLVAVVSALLLSGVVVVLGESALAGSSLTPRVVYAYLSDGLPGWARLARVLIEAGLLLTVLFRRRLSVAALAGIVIALALAGHGADVEPSWQGIVVNAAHLGAAGIWAGGIMALALVRVGRQWDTVGARLLPLFSKVAPWAFGASVVLGGIQALQLMGGLGPLLTTGYGRTLVVKGCAVALMVPLSYLAWRRIRISVREEALLALVVVGAAAALAAFPITPKEAREAEAAAATTIKGVQWAPGPGDLALGGRAGAVMVGLSLHPGLPGRNTVKVYLASPAGRRTTAAIGVGSATSTKTPMTPCGILCRTATVVLAGHDTLHVAVSGRQAGTAVYHLPALPAPDAAAFATKADATMEALTSVRVAENLSGIRSAYRYKVPHQMFLRTWYTGGSQDTLWVGPDLYRRTSPTAPWKLQTHGDKVPAPYYAWTPFRPFVDARVIGHSTIHGVPVTVVSLFGGHGNSPEPVWFTLWVDPGTHQVLHSRMWAPNHFMSDFFLGLDKPVSIPVPPAP